MTARDLGGHAYFDYGDFQKALDCYESIRLEQLDPSGATSPSLVQTRLRELRCQSS